MEYGVPNYIFIRSVYSSLQAAFQNDDHHLDCKLAPTATGTQCQDHVDRLTKQ